MILRILLILNLLYLPSRSQYIFDWIELDTLVIGYNPEFNTEDFVNIMLDDTSFYKSFKNLFLHPHTSSTNISVYNKNEQEKGGLLREAEHFHKNDSSWIVITKDESNGKYYNRKKENNYYTGEMFDKVFFPTDTVYYPNNLAHNPYEQKSWNSKTEKHYEQLKRFVFAPGSDIKGVPIIGDKLSIFSPEMRIYYDFKLTMEEYRGKQCYSFICIPKKGIDEDELVIRYLKTYFDKENFAVLSRDYHIKHNTVLFDFDIFIKVRIDETQGQYLPNKITYKGWWNTPLSKAEILNVEMINRYH